METSIKALFTILKESLIKFVPSGGSTDIVLTGRKGAVLAANLDELITRDLGRSISPPLPRAQEMNISRTNNRGCLYS
jgi:hypothetical protein